MMERFARAVRRCFGALALAGLLPLAAPAQEPEPIDLATALRLAATSNLDIAQARVTVEQARAIRLRALSQALPNFSLGAVWDSHEGRIQQTDGNIQNFNRDSLFVGGGPSWALNLSDSLFGPLVARQLMSAAAAGAERVTNDTLLIVADTYLQMLRARRRLTRADYILVHITDEKPSDLRGGSKGLLPLVRDVVEAGGKDAFKSDVARLEVEVARRREERVTYLQDLLQQSRELSRLLRLDPSLPLLPVDDLTNPIAIPGDEMVKRDLQDLIAFALANRPEVREQAALTEASRDRLRAARLRPLTPTFVTTGQWGGFGGSPIRDPFVSVAEPFNGPTPLALSPSGEVHRFGPRTDIEMSLHWQLNGLGLGNRAEVREQQAATDIARLREVQARDRVAAQVAQARDLTAQADERIALTRPALFDEKGEPVGAAYRSIRLNFDRIRGTEGRPLEALDSIRGLSDMLDAYIQAISDSERARARLTAAVGLFR
jgi:outer membrane protein TolC